MMLKIIYEKLKQSHFAVWFFPKGVHQDAAVLGKKEESYYTQKLSYVGGLLLFAIVLLVFYSVQHMAELATPTKEIIRPDAYEETQKIMLQAGTPSYTYELEVAPRILTKEQADTLFQQVIEKLDTYILGENTALDCVTNNLFLPEYISEYPFEIYWESDNEHIVDTLGTVNREGLTEDEVVMLTAVFRYQDWLWEEQFGILVCKEALTEEERYKRQLGSLLTESEKGQRQEREWVLPEDFEGEDLQVYTLKQDYTLPVLAGLILLTAVAVWIGMDHDLHMDRQKRRSQFQEEYLSFVGSLSLYISAGLTLQAAMQYCTRDYVKRKPQSNLLRNALQEFGRDLQNGCGFTEAMNHLADKTDDANYKRLGGILNQGILNGSKGLAEALDQEAGKIREEKRRQNKIKGEQVSTALIAPMMLQLGIIIALIMIPAFTNMQF